MQNMPQMHIRKRIDAIFRPDPPKKDKALAGMAHWAKRLDEQFLARARHRARVHKALASTRGAVPQIFESGAGFEKARAKARAALRKCKPPKLSPVKVPKHVDRIFSGSVGATYGPPYDVQWTWSEQQGDPPSPFMSADANSGTMALNAVTLDDRSAVAARAAVGNWLSAGVGTSTMNIFAAPAIDWSWQVQVVENWGESAGWLGFVVQSFDRAGNFVDTVIEQQLPIWDVQLNAPSWPWPGWLQAQWNQGATSGYSLQGQFMAVEGLWYTIWIWFGVYAAEGDNCIATFAPVTVPFFTWENG
jgi:hypothetical protein